MDYYSITISIVALLVSLGTFWLLYIDRGRLRMTKPTIVFIGFDAPKSIPKVFFRTLLYSTATRGQVVEGMYVVVRHDGRECIFSFWGYGDVGKLSPGSGLYVDRTGVTFDHHFLISIDDKRYCFGVGEYEIDVIANVVGCRKPVKLHTIKLTLSDAMTSVLMQKDGVLFERKISGEYEGSRMER